MVKKVAVIIVNYKTTHLIRNLVSSINESRVDISIILVDNASTQESNSQLMLLNDSRMQILRSEQNLGFTGGINLALKYLDNKQEFKYFFLINPDAFSTTDLISDLMQVLESDQTAAGVSPQIVHLNGSPWYTGGIIKYAEGRVINRGVEDVVSPSDFCEVDVFSGCAVLFDLDKVMEAGMFNEDLFMYFDEADLSIRLKKKGYKILYCHQLKILHDVSYTTRNISHLKAYYMTRNKFIVFNNDMSLFHKVYFILYQLAYQLKHWRLKNAFYHLKGLYDFKKGKRGSLVIP